jgi:hypothetical protein
MVETWKIPNGQRQQAGGAPNLEELVEELYRQRLAKELEREGSRGLLRRSPPQAQRPGGKLTKQDKAYQEAILLIQRVMELIAYPESLLLQFDEASHRAIVALIQQLEEDNSRYAPGSLAQIVDHSLTVQAAKNLSGLHMKLTHSTAEKLEDITDTLFAQLRQKLSTLFEPRQSWF